MNVYTYAITLETPLGIKRGTFVRNSDGVNESGYIEIFGVKNPYCAKIEPTGKCSISGRLKTIVKDFTFDGDGYIYPDRLEIILRGKKSSCKMQGVIKEVSSENEKVL